MTWIVEYLEIEGLPGIKNKKKINYPKRRQVPMQPKGKRERERRQQGESPDLDHARTEARQEIAAAAAAEKAAQESEPEPEPEPEPEQDLRSSQNLINQLTMWSCSKVLKDLP